MHSKRVEEKIAVIRGNYYALHRVVRQTRHPQDAGIYISMYSSGAKCSTVVQHLLLFCTIMNVECGGSSTGG
jgi:hypothetical protein